MLSPLALLFVLTAPAAVLAGEERSYKCRTFKLALSKQEGKDMQFNVSTDAKVSRAKHAL